MFCMSDFIAYVTNSTKHTFSCLLFLLLYQLMFGETFNCFMVKLLISANASPIVRPASVSRATTVTFSAPVAPFAPTVFMTFYGALDKRLSFVLQLFLLVCTLT